MAPLCLLLIGALALHVSAVNANLRHGTQPGRSGAGYNSPVGPCRLAIKMSQKGLRRFFWNHTTPKLVKSSRGGEPLYRMKCFARLNKWARLRKCHEAARAFCGNSENAEFIYEVEEREKDFLQVFFKDQDLGDPASSQKVKLFINCHNETEWDLKKGKKHCHGDTEFEYDTALDDVYYHKHIDWMYSGNSQQALDILREWQPPTGDYAVSWGPNITASCRVEPPVSSELREMTAASPSEISPAEFFHPREIGSSCDAGPQIKTEKLGAFLKMTRECTLSVTDQSDTSANASLQIDFKHVPATQSTSRHVPMAPGQFVHLVPLQVPEFQLLSTANDSALKQLRGEKRHLYIVHVQLKEFAFPRLFNRHRVKRSVQRKQLRRKNATLITVTCHSGTRTAEILGCIKAVETEMNEAPVVYFSSKTASILKAGMNWTHLPHPFFFPKREQDYRFIIDGPWEDPLQTTSSNNQEVAAVDLPLSVALWSSFRHLNTQWPLVQPKDKWAPNRYCFGKLKATYDLEIWILRAFSPDDTSGMEISLPMLNRASTSITLTYDKGLLVFSDDHGKEIKMASSEQFERFLFTTRIRDSSKRPEDHVGTSSVLVSCEGDVPNEYFRNMLEITIPHSGEGPGAVNLRSTRLVR